MSIARPFDLIFVSLENWDAIWRRNQFLCAGLARRFPEMRILFVGLPRDVSHQFRRGRLGELRGAGTWDVPEFPNITVTHPWKLAPNSVAGGRRLNELMARRHVRGAAGRIGFEAPILWLNPHSAVHMAGRMGECAVVYDITDDWALASISPQERRLIEEQDRRLCRRADLVVMCSEALERSRRAHCRRRLLLPNGVDAEHYQAAAAAPTPVDRQRWPAPVFGYTGTLHSDRIDVHLVLALARAFPEGSVVLVGPDHLNDEARRLLRATGNVSLTGPVPYARIPAQMASFDVCIVPHIESDFTESLNPIKLWEYLACGKPIVATNIAGFRSFAHLCQIASGPAAFVAACRAALVEDGTLCAARRAEAARHNWSSRLDQLLEALQTLQTANPHVSVPRPGVAFKALGR